MQSLTPKEIDTQRQALLTLRTEIETVLRQSREGAKPVKLDQQTVGRLSRIDAIQQQKMAEANRQRHMLRLNRIKAALNAISDNQYGLCRRCEEPIRVQRLKVQPECAICLDCQACLERRT